MADAVTSQTLADGDKTAVIKFTNISDGNGESSVEKIDISGLAVSNAGLTPSRATIEQIWYDIGGMRVALEWNATTNVVAAVLGGSAAVGVSSGYLDFRSFGGLKNTEASGADGNIDLTTHGHTSHDHYTIVLQIRKSY